MPTAEEVRAAHRRRLDSEKAASLAQSPKSGGPTAAEVIAAHKRRKTQEPETPSYLQRAVPAFIEKPFESMVNIREQLAGTVPEWLGGAAEREAAASMREDLRSVQAAAGPEGPFRTGMNIAGQVAEFAGPGAAGVALGRQALQRLSQALARRRSAQVAAPLAGEVATVSGYEAARTPGTPAEKAEAAALAAGGTLAGYGVGAGLQKAVQGVRRSQQGEELVKYGATPGQVAEGRFVPWAENQLQRVPGWGGGINRLRGKAIERWNEDILKGIWPGAEGIGHSAIEGIQKNLGKSYDELWKQVASVTPYLPADFEDVAGRYIWTQAISRLGGEAGDRVGNFLTQQVGTLRSGNSGAVWQQFNTKLREHATAARGRGDLVEAEIIEDVRDQFLDSLPEKMAARLKELNNAYKDLKVIERATRFEEAAASGGIFSPVDLLKASRGEGNRRLFAAGNAAMQQPARAALGLSPSVQARREALGPQWGPGVAVGGAGISLGGIPGALTAYGAGIPLTTEPVRRALVGQLPIVQSDRTREIVRQLRRGQGPAGAAVAVQTERD